MHASTTNTTNTVTFTTNKTTTTTLNTTSIAITWKSKSIQRKFFRNIGSCKLSKGHISYVIALTNFINFKLPGLDERDVRLTIRQNMNTTVATRTTAISINDPTINTNAATVTAITPTKFYKKKCKIFNIFKKLQNS